MKISEESAYLFLVTALLAIVDTVLIVVQLHLEPGDKHPTKHHSVVIIRCMSLNIRRQVQTHSCKVLSGSYQPSSKPVSRNASKPGQNRRLSCDQVISGLIFFFVCIHLCCTNPSSIRSCICHSNVCALAMPKFSVPGSL